MPFENTYAEQLPDTVVDYEPPGFPDPVVVYLDQGLADALDLQDLDADVLSGTRIPDGARPVAMAYAGHQFGHFSPQLGDGRAFLLGEVVGPEGRRWDLHLKGSGRTPFSRGGDGLASLGPMLREVVVGHAMHHLGIPTTRALAVVTTGQQVLRQEGHLPGAVLTRIAASHLRVGTLEYFAARGKRDVVRKLIDYAIARHCPDADGPLGLLDHVADRQAELIASWMAVGFVHGVMNTDNTTLSGETIDYGPCAFMDVYDPATVFSSIDHAGRYAYGNQPRVGQWNLARLAEAMLPDIPIEGANAALERYQSAYTAALLSRFRAKLGLPGTRDDDAALIERVLGFLHAEQRDFTSFFRQLARAGRSGDLSGVLSAELGDAWLARCDGSPDVDGIHAVNPVYIARNHQVEAALDAAVHGDLQPFRTLMAVLAQPFDPELEWVAYGHPAPSDFGPYRTFCGT